MVEKTKTRRPLPAAALVLAWLVPGVGHMYIGRPARGVIILLTIAATFWAGVAVGGVLTVDRYDEPWWFVAQIFAGVHGLVGYYRQKRDYDELAREIDGSPTMARNTDGSVPRSVAHQKLAAKGLFPPTTTASVARVYAGVAGLLNLMCIFDAFILALIGRCGEGERRAARQQE